MWGVSFSYEETAVVAVIPITNTRDLQGWYLRWYIIAAILTLFDSLLLKWQNRNEIHTIYQCLHFQCRGSHMQNVSSKLIISVACIYFWLSIGGSLFFLVTFFPPFVLYLMYLINVQFNHVTWIKYFKMGGKGNGLLSYVSNCSEVFGMECQV